MNRLTIFVFIFLFNLPAMGVNAQLKWSVIDKESGLPIKGATAFLQSEADSSITYSTITDDLGIFEFFGLANGSYMLSVSFAGYGSASEHIDISNGILHSSREAIALSVTPTLLQNITVNAKKPLVVFRHDKVTLNVSESPVAPAGNAWEAMLKAPGVTERNGEATFRGKSISVLINGRKLSLSGEELKNMLSGMPANTIDKIEILPNPSAKYDADGNVVLDIRLSRNKNYGMNGSLTGGIGGGRYLHSNTGLNLNYRNKKLYIYGGYHLNSNKKYSQVLSDRDPGETARLLESAYSEIKRTSQSYKAGLDYEFNKNNVAGLLLNAASIDRRKEANNTSRRKTGALFDTLSTVTAVGAAQYFIPSANLYFKTRLDSSGKQLLFNADYVSYDKSWADHFVTQLHDYPNAHHQQPYFLRNQLPAAIQIKSLSADYESPLKNGHIEAGLKTSFTTSDNNSIWKYKEGAEWFPDISKTNRFIYNEHIHAAYFNYNSSFNDDKYQLTAGLRMEQTRILTRSETLDSTRKLSYTNLFPNVSFAYNLNDDNIFGISYKKSIVRYGFDVVNPFTIYQSQYTYRQGNPDIKPEISHSLDFSYAYKQKLVFGASYSLLTKVLAPVYIKKGDTVTHSYNNLRSADMFYFYNNWYQTVGNIWTSNLYTYLGFLRYNVSSEASEAINANWVFQTAWENSFRLQNGWSAEFSANLITPHASGISKVNEVFFADVGMSKSILHKKGVLKLSVSDIFNSNRQDESINYQGLRMHVNQKAESRFIRLQFTYRFGNKNVKGAGKRESKVSDLQSRTDSN